nr:hypothetical protein [Kribbella antiqua]
MTSLVQAGTIAARYSSVMAPRRSNGTPRAAYSSDDQPEPTPSTNRPLLKASRLAPVRATCKGCR